MIDTSLLQAPARGPVEQQRPPVWDSATLLRGHTEVVIRHGEAEYRLRLTRNDKLILLK